MPRAPDAATRVHEFLRSRPMRELFSRLARREGEPPERSLLVGIKLSEAARKDRGSEP